MVFRGGLIVMDHLASKRGYMAPINIMVLYNFFTLFLFIISAWNYKITNYGLIILVVTVNLCALYIGYYAAVRAHKEFGFDEKNYDLLKDNDSRVIELLKKWTRIAAIIAIPDMLYYSRMWTLSPAQILNRLVIGLTESNLNYSLSLGYENSGTIIEKIVVLVTVLLYTFKFAVLPLSLLYWKKIDRKQKFLCFFVVALDIIKWLLKGMNKGIFDYAFVFVASALIIVANGKRQRSYQSANNEPAKKSKRGKIVLLTGIIVFFAINIFISNIVARSSRLTTAYYSTSMQITADPDNILLKLMPVSLHKPILSLEMYLTCGYQGLSYALRLPFKWCYGIGNNQFTISNFRDAFGIDVSALTYQARVERAFPWLEFHNWHSTYTWLANDFSFFLLPLVFFFLGYICALSWMSSIEKHNPYAIVIFCLFIIRLAYLPANNIVLSSSFTFITWFVCMVLWYLSSHGIGIRMGKTILFKQSY